MVLKSRGGVRAVCKRDTHNRGRHLLIQFYLRSAERLLKQLYLNGEGEVAMFHRVGREYTRYVLSRKTNILVSAFLSFWLLREHHQPSQLVYTHFVSRLKGEQGFR